MEEIYTVGQITTLIKDSLAKNFQSITLVGEISNFSRSSSGHCYFTLSDQEASLSCAFFRFDAIKCRFLSSLKNGDKIEVFGNVDLYIKRGDLQFIVKKLIPCGKGDLKQQFEALKKRLAQEGLFDMEIKKKIPYFPRRIGLITAGQSAAFYDFFNIFKRRSLWMNILLSEALVQGDLAPSSLRKALHRLIEYSIKADDDQKIDVIVFTRGGGSMEDLWAFNDEGLAWDIYNCPIPVISAVGHQVDFTISDFVSDFRCETPSAAAEALTKGQLEISSHLKRAQTTLINRLENLRLQYKNNLKEKGPERVLEFIQKRFYQLEKKFLRLDILKNPHQILKIYDKERMLDDYLKSLLNSLQKDLLRDKNRLEKIEKVLKAIDPQNVLERGFIYVTTKEDKIVVDKKTFQKLEKKSMLNLHFKDGNVSVTKDGE